MIGTLLFHALYPLSRYLIYRASEASEKGVSPAILNGTAVWDGGAIQSRRFTKLETTLQNQHLSPTSDLKGKTKEKEDLSTEKQNGTTVDMDTGSVIAILHKDPNSNASEVIEVKEKEMVDKPGAVLERVEHPKQLAGEAVSHHKVLHLKQGKEEGSCSPTGEISPDQIPNRQFESLQINESLQETDCPIWDPNLEELLTQAEDSILETSSYAKEQIQEPQVTESLPFKEATDEIIECWDEYLLSTSDETHSGAHSSTVVVAFPLSDTENHFKVRGQDYAQTCFHFPVGPGLAEEMQCPLWQFPTVSHYPPVEQTVPFEVEWRVWIDESATSAESTLIPFPFTKTTMDFTVMSYNILAQNLLELNPFLYTHCPLEVLQWNYRCSLLLKDIQKWFPDILCLQEVQENHYHEHLYPALSQMGYTCVYKRRTGTKTDGCATCYRSTRFSEIAVTHLEFFRPETELLDRHNVGIVLLLRPLDTQGSKVTEMGSPLCVTNTHLLFNPRRGDVKLAQLAIILAEIDNVIKSCKAKGENCNVILCGDFNSVPHMPLYQLITTGELHYQGLPAWMISGQEDLSHKTSCQRLFAPLWPSSLGITENCQYTSVNKIFEKQKEKSGKHQYTHDFMLQLRYCPASCIRPRGLKILPGVTDCTPDPSSGSQLGQQRLGHSVSHRLNLKSVYKHILPGSGYPEVTTLHSEMGNTVDYIFYTPRHNFSSVPAGGKFSSEGLKLIGYLSLLSEDILWSMKGLPNDTFPSDHLSLMAKFQINVSTV
ncbi:protein angel homolog 1 [Pholidichthys leucotaenia]